MKVFRFFLFVLSMTAFSCFAQQSEAELAKKIAQKMRDSLSLNNKQASEIFSINVQLARMKKEMRSRYTNTDSLRRSIQRVENKRDSLYQSVLNPAQYSLYRQKKRNLVNNN